MMKKTKRQTGGIFLLPILLWAMTIPLYADVIIDDFENGVQGGWLCVTEGGAWGAGVPPHITDAITMFPSQDAKYGNGAAIIKNDLPKWSILKRPVDGSKWNGEDGISVWVKINDLPDGRNMTLGIELRGEQNPDFSQVKRWRLSQTLKGAEWQRVFFKFSDFKPSPNSITAKRTESLNLSDIRELSFFIMQKCEMEIDQIQVGKKKAYEFTSLDIQKQANMGFKDEVADDRTGGWTDQGPNNDLRMLKSGKQNFGGVEFQIIDPDLNSGKSCLAFAGNARKYFIDGADLEVKGTEKYLYLLHSLAWSRSQPDSVGRIIVSYTNGSQKTIPVNASSDVGDWWAPISRPNGAVVWTGENRQSYVCLFLSKYEISDGKAVSSIRLESSGNAVWLVVAATTSNDEIFPTDNRQYHYIVAGREWRPFEYERDIIPNSVMDFSTWQDAPAGKHGFLQVKDGKFVFADAPEVPVRFYGVNLAIAANFLDREWCERLADRLAMSGYNAVRFHLIDGWPTRGLAQNRPSNTDSTKLDQDKMDQLDYLFYCLKKRGIYLTIDLYGGRSVQKGEIPELPDLDLDMTSFKSLVFVLDSVMDNWKEFSRNLLTHVNPYTKLAWKDDPALITICLVNEATEQAVENAIRRCQSPIHEIYERKFKKWLQEKNLVADVRNREALFRRFLIDIRHNTYAQMQVFLRELGVQSLAVGQNQYSNSMAALVRNRFDLVDNHFYWDHPHYAVKPAALPSTLKNESALKQWATAPGASFPSRIFGKPMCITEFNFANPNFFRAESGPLVGAYAGLQDWDALFRYSYASLPGQIKYQETIHAWFAIACDPINALSDRIALSLFLRGDVKRSDLAFPTVISAQCLESALSTQNYPRALWSLGLVGQSGAVVLENEELAETRLPAGTVAVTSMEPELGKKKWNRPFFLFPSESSDSTLQHMVDSGVVDKAFADIENGIFMSSTREIKLDAPMEIFQVVTPKSEVFILPAGSSAKGKMMKVENGNLSRGVFSISTVDGMELRKSKRILLLHLTDCHGNKTKFNIGNKQTTILESWGELPYLIQNGEARITLNGDFAGYKLYGVGTSGKRIVEIPLEQAPGIVSFDAKIFSPSGILLAYELVKE